MPPNNTNIPNNSTGQPTPNVPPQVVQPSVPAQPAPTVIQPSAAVTPPPVADTASAQPAVTVVASQPAASQSVFTAASDRPKGRWRRKLAIIGIVTGIVAILGCGAAFAYFGFYLPQQPDYVLKTAIKNSLSQHQFTAKGLIKATDSSSGAKSA